MERSGFLSMSRLARSGGDLSITCKEEKANTQKAAASEIKADCEKETHRDMLWSKKTSSRNELLHLGSWDVVGKTQ
eukprot:3848290-Amphidinium_carterae.1